jgi:hypothetical protein
MPKPPLKLPPLPSGLAALRHQWNSYCDYVVSRLWPRPSQLANEALAAVSAAMGYFLPLFKPVKVEEAVAAPSRIRVVEPAKDEEDYQIAYATALETVLPGQWEACRAFGKLIARRLPEVKAAYSPEQLSERLARLLQDLTSQAEGEVETFLTSLLRRIDDYLQKHLADALEGKMSYHPSPESLSILLLRHLGPALENLKNPQDQALGQLLLKFLEKQSDLIEERYNLLADQLVGPKAIASHFFQLIDAISGGKKESKKDADSPKHIKSKILTDEGSDAVENIIRIVLRDAMHREGLSLLNGLFAFHRGGIDKGLSLLLRKNNDKVILDLTPLAPAIERAADKLLEEKASTDATEWVNAFFAQSSDQLTGKWKAAEYVNGFTGLGKLYALFRDQPSFLRDLLHIVISEALMNFYPLSFK